MYARPSHAGTALTFGVSGKLWKRTLVLFDRQTGSLWSQREDRAVAGQLVGRSLEVLPSTVTEWRTWRSAHPATRVARAEPEVGPWGDVLRRASSYGAFAALAVLIVTWMILRRRLRHTVRSGKS